MHVPVQASTRVSICAHRRVRTLRAHACPQLPLSPRLRPLPSLVSPLSSFRNTNYMNRPDDKNEDDKDNDDDDDDDDNDNDDHKHDHDNDDGNNNDNDEDEVNDDNLF